MADNQALLTLKEMSAVLRTTPRTLQKHVRGMTIPYLIIDGKQMFDRSQVVQYLEVDPNKSEPQPTVYLIHAKGTNFYKIGFTLSGIKQRLEALQTNTPHELDLLATRTGPRGLEALLHCFFDEQRVRGEWFEFTDHPRIVVRRFHAAPEEI